MHQFIAAAYGAESVSEHIDSENYSTAVGARTRYSALIGHFWFRPGETLDPHRINVTVLRDPIDRVLSHFYFSADWILPFTLPRPSASWICHFRTQRATLGPQHYL